MNIKLLSMLCGSVSEQTLRRMRHLMVLVLSGVCLPGQAQTVEKPLRFETVFNETGQPASLRYTTRFQSDGGLHTLDVWRLKDEHLKRVTDGVLEVHVERKSGDPEFHMTVLDLQKHLATRVDRTNLYRIGNFTDWFDLAHGIRQPAGAYQLARGKMPSGMPPVVQACDWYDLSQAGKTRHICWSRQVKLPLLMVAPNQEIIWQVTRLQTQPISKTLFAVHDEGFVRNDANQDIERD